MSRWLETYFAGPADAVSSEKKTENASPGEPTKLTKPSSVGFVSASGQQVAKNSGPSDPLRYPLFYTDAEREAARLDARRLGYPGRTIH
jgi:hypothetical protein